MPLLVACTASHRVPEQGQEAGPTRMMEGYRELKSSSSVKLS